MVVNIDLLSIIRAWLGTMFVCSAGMKLADYPSSRSVVSAYGILPASFTRPIGLALPWFEMLVGLVILFAGSSVVGPMLGIALAICFVVATSMVLRRGTPVPCGCSGSADDTVTLRTLARSLFILACSIAAVVGTAFHPTGSLSHPAALGLTAIALGPGILKYRARRKVTADLIRQAEIRVKEVARWKEILSSEIVDYAPDL